MPKCNKCSNPIEFVKMKSGKLMPVDPLKLKIVTTDGTVVTGQESHFSTCPYADDFRKK